MRKIFFIYFLIITSCSFGQKAEIENLINQIAVNEVPEKFEYYFLVPKSMEQPKIYDSLQNHRIRELGILDKEFPLNLIYEQSKENTDWKNYDLKKIKYVINEYNYQTTAPPIRKNVQFVTYNIDQSKFDSLIRNKKPSILIIKKKWYWNKKRIWSNKKFYNELVKAWKMDKKQNIEDKVYFQFSKPIFSKDRKYAKVSISINRRCSGDTFTALYSNDKGLWKKLIQYNHLKSVVSTTHSKCEEISIAY